MLVTYEQDVIGDAAKGTLPGEIVYPPSTVLSEHTLVILDKNIAPADRPLIDALVAFLWSEPAQSLFVHNGFRSVDERLNGGEPATSGPSAIRSWSATSAAGTW